MVQLDAAVWIGVVGGSFQEIHGLFDNVASAHVLPRFADSISDTHIGHRCARESWTDRDLRMQFRMSI